MRRMNLWQHVLMNPKHPKIEELIKQILWQTILMEPVFVGHLCIAKKKKLFEYCLSQSV